MFRPNLILATPGLSGYAEKVLRTLARTNWIAVEDSGRQTCAGVYAKVISPGQVRTGDVVYVGPASDDLGEPAE